MPKAAVVALNVDGTGDMSYDGGAIPFDDGSFDVVVSLDTLEHVPPSGRVDFHGRVHACGTPHIVSCGSLRHAWALGV